jgi:iron complex outermembrane receptor protein
LVFALFVVRAHATEQRYEIDIPALKVDVALKTLARQTEAQLLFPYDVVKTLQANPVSGRYTLHEALEILLQDTGLSSSLTKGGVITISATSVTAQGDGNKNMNGMKKLSLLGHIAALLGIGIGPHMVRAQADTAGQGPVLSEIIVTAQRRSESLQETPVAVSVISGDELAAKHINDISSVGAVTPSVGFQAGTNAQAVSSIEIRGLGAAGSNRAFEGDVGIFVDGVYLSRTGQLLSNFLDYDNLQILKGPQGTLFGKNTTAGALMLTSTKPQFNDYDGSYEVTIGNYGEELVRVASNIPVSDVVAVRAAALFSNNAGYLKNPNTDDYYNSHRPRAFKLQLLYEPTADLSFRLISDISIEHDNCCYGTVVIAPGPAQPLINALTLANGFQLASSNPKDYQAVLNQDTDEQIGDRGAVLLSDWDISPSAALHSTTAYRVWSESQLGGDFDFSAADILNGKESFKTHQFSQEFTFDGKVGETPLFKSANYLLGVYVAHEVLLATRELFWGQQAQTYWNVALASLGIPPGIAGASPGLFSSELYPADDKSYATFAHVNLKFTDKFGALAGIRYSKEIKHGTFENPYFGSAVPPTVPVLTLIGVQPGPTYNAEHSDNAISGTAGFQYDFAPGKMGYLTYSRGFKAGGINLDNNAAGLVANNPAYAALGAALHFVPAAPLNPTYQPEKIDGFEVGFKADYLDGRARSNLALFYDKITGLQVGEFQGLQFIVVNAPSGKEYGAEIENTFRVTQEVTLNAAATWLPFAEIGASALLDQQAAITKASGGVGISLSGTRFSQAPRWATNVGASLFHPLNDRIALTGDLSEQFKTRINIDLADGYGQGSVALLNTSLGVASVERTWSVNVWCMNCADQRYNTITFPVPLQSGTEGAYVGAPRTFGMSLRGRF